jgi:hypothetical protein
MEKRIIIEEQILTSAQVAEILNSSKRVIEKKLRAGEIRGSKRLNRWFVLKSDLVRYIEEGRQTSGELSSLSRKSKKT